MCLNEKLPVIFIGYSYGGNVAYECAFNLSIKHGIDVDHCIKVATPSYADEDVEVAYFDGLAADRAAFTATGQYVFGQREADEGYNITVYTGSLV
jgi:thioesterase domain-containing protein